MILKYEVGVPCSLLPPLLPDLQDICIEDVVVATTLRLGSLGGAGKIQQKWVGENVENMYALCSIVLCIVHTTHSISL